MDPVVLAVFLVVYLGMVLGRLPGLAIDRTGVALLGAIVLVAARRVSPQAAWEAIDVPTVALLLGLMVVSAQLRLGGFYSNVPAVMLLLPAAHHADAGPILALASTLAGNLLLVGSIANLIVVESAARLGIRIGWRQHARTGVPVTVASLAIAAAWLAVRVPAAPP